MEDNLQWETTFYGRQSFMEDDLCWKTIFHGRIPFMEDNGRQPLTEDDHLVAAT